MKKRNDNKKEVAKIRLKKTKGSMVNKRTNQREPDLWEEIRLKLKPLNKVYNKFREKRRIAKEKEEQRRLKLDEEQRLREEAALSLQEQEDRKLKKEKKIKEDEERRLKTQEKQRLEEKRKKEEREERIRQKRIYKERLAKAERTRLAQLESAIETRKEEKELAEQTRLKIERRLGLEQRLKNKEEPRLKEKEQRLKEESRIAEEQKLKREEEQNLKEKIRFDDKQKKKRLNGKVKWFSSTKGYGFIEREGEEKDIFVHFSAVKNSGLKYLKEGEQLTFEVEYSDKGTSAINLQKTVNEVSRSHLRVVK